MQHVWRKSGSFELAEDVVHDAFLRVSNSLPSITNPVAYLRKAVVNGVRDRYRGNRIRGIGVLLILGRLMASRQGQ